MRHENANWRNYALTPLDCQGQWAYIHNMEAPWTLAPEAHWPPGMMSPAFYHLQSAYHVVQGLLATTKK